MFDLTDDVENSPNATQKAKPTEVKIDYEIKDEKLKKEIPKEEPPDWKDKKNDELNDYDYSDDPELDDTKW